MYKNYGAINNSQSSYKKISQSVARSGFTNLKPYKNSITKAKTAPRSSAGSIMILIILIKLLHVQVDQSY